MTSQRIVVVGGSAAGPKAAARAKRMDQNAHVTMIQKAPELSMASCGYPYYVGGFFDRREELLCTPTGVVRDENFFAGSKGIEARTQTEVVAIDREAKEITCKDLQSGETFPLGYDTLILATGATPRVPPIPGTDLEGITTLHAMRDADYLRKLRDEGGVKKAVVIGGGLIGIETCEALQLAGMEVTVVELLPQILMFLDWELAKLLENHVKDKAANVITDNAVSGFLGQDGKLSGIKLQSGTELECELAVLAIGVQPNVQLAREAGLDIGETGGIAVDETMQTSDAHIFAAGDCIEIPNRLTGQKTLAPYGDLANLQGRVAGENAVLKSNASFPGTLHTGICKVFDFAAGSTGLSEEKARQAGFNVITGMNASLDKPGFMGGQLLVSKMVVDADSQRLLGYQCVGPGDVSRQISEAAMALAGKQTIPDLVNADLPYAPPFSLAIDHLITAAHIVENKLKGRMVGIANTEVKAKLDAGEAPFFLDTRVPAEYESTRLGLGETLIPLGKLRERLNELPQDTNKEIICFCKISMRGYEAQRILWDNGWTNVKVMEGGIMAWPYRKEK